MAYQPLATQIGAVYTLTGPDGSVAVFNDPSSPNYVGMLTEVTGLDSAEVRESASDMVEADGGAHGTFYLGRRPVVLNGKVFGHTTEVERSLRLDRARRASLALRGDAVLKWTPPVPSYESSVLSLGPSLYLPLGAESGLTDRSGNGRHGAAVGGVTIGGGPSAGDASVFGTSTDFDGVDDKITTAYNPFANGTARTFAWAMKLDTLPSAGTVVFTGSTVGVTAPALQVQANGLVAWYSEVGQGVVSVAPAGTVVAGQAAFFAFVFDEANNVVRFYKNGVLVQTTSSVTYTYGGSPGTLWISGYSGQFIDGWVAHFAGFEREVTATEVASLHSASAAQEVFVNVRRQQPFRETGAWVKDFQIPLVSADAIIQSTSQVTVAAGVAAENKGNYPAYPIISITGVSGSPTVTAGGLVFRTTVDLSVASGETVEFDLLNHTGRFTAGARNGQSANRYINFATTQWPYLAGLGTTQTFTLSGGGTLSVKYRHTWA